MRAFGQKNTFTRKVVTWVAAMTLVLSMIPLMDFARAAEECENHGEDTIVETVSIKATCTEAGEEGTIVKCANCNEVIEDNTTTTFALGHKEVACEERAATCLADGTTGGTFCKVCGETVTAPTVVPAKGHNFTGDENGKDATCTTAGRTESTSCTECGYVETPSVTTPARGHNLTKVEEAATCPKAADVIYYTCSACDKIFEDADGKNETTLDVALSRGNHTIMSHEGNQASCTDTGLTDGIKCSTCGEMLVGQQLVQALGHDKETLNGYAATCTENGMTNGERCKRCGDIIVEQKVIPATGHLYGNWFDDPSNNNHYHICGYDTGHVEEAAHVYGEWVITEGATIYASGRQQRVCTDCGHAEQAVVAKLAKAVVRVQYVNEDGKILTTRHTMNLAKDSAYDMSAVAKRIPAGYEADGEPYGDDIAGIADSNKTIYVPVKKVEVAETPEAPAPAATDNDVTPIVAADDADNAIADDENPMAAPEDEQTIADDENPMANSVQLVEEPALVETSAASNGIAWGVGIVGAAVLGIGVVTLAGGAAATGAAAGGAAASSAATSGTATASRIRRKN